MTTTPHIHRLRYHQSDRVRHGDNLLDWLNAQATRLGVTVTAVFAMLRSGASAADVDSTPTPDPDPEEEEG